MMVSQLSREQECGIDIICHMLPLDTISHALDKGFLFMANLMHLLNCTSHIHQMLQETWWCHHSKPVTHEVMRLACMKKHLVLLQRYLYGALSPARTELS
jgi:hypothetical protein